MNTLLWVLVGILVYSVVALSLRQQGILPDSVRVQGPLTTIHTKRGKAFLDWLARPKRFWRAWSNVGVGIAVVIMVGVFVLLAVQAVAILQNPPQPTAVNQPRNFLVIPGVNDFLPLAVAPEIVTGLLVGLVVHEGGHGLLCRVEDIDIESMGLVLFTLIPVGAFVEPDEESQAAADRGSQTRMFAAGVTNNFAVTVVAFVLLFGPVVGAISVAPGVAVAGAYAGSPAAQAGIEQGDRVTAIAGRNVTTDAQLERALLNADDRTVRVTVADGEGRRTVSVERSLLVSGSVAGNPANLTVSQGEEPIRVTAVNGTPVHTEAAFREAIQNRTFVSLDTSTGQRTMPVGAYILDVQEGGPLAATPAPDDGGFVITSIAGEHVTSAADLGAALDATDPGQTVEVRAYVDGAFETYRVTLAENPRNGNGFLGVTIFPGTSGLTFTDFGVQSYPAGAYLEFLGGDGGPGAMDDIPPAFQSLANGLLGKVYIALMLPLIGIQLPIPNFPGFTQATANFYTVTGPLSVFGGWVFLFANVLFWTAWINLQLGLFNCIPGYPLDGGRILRNGVEAVVSRLPVDQPYAVVRTITTSIGLLMLVSLLLMVFGPSLLSR